MHYTDDVLVAWMLTLLVWKLFHFYADPLHVHDTIQPFRWLEGYDVAIAIDDNNLSFGDGRTRHGDHRMSSAPLLA